MNEDPFRALEPPPPAESGRPSAVWLWLVIVLLGIGALAVGLVLALRGDDESAGPEGATGAPTTVAGTQDGPDQTTAEGDPAGPSPSWEPSRCRFTVPSGRDVQCGYLVVPEDRTEPDGPQVRLHVAVFAAAGDPAPDPILYLEGGPGGEALESLEFSFDDLVAPYLAERDFVIFDQRGTGYSEPALSCPEYREAGLELLEQDLSPEDDVAAQLEALSRCRTRLVADGADLTAYNSANSAADIADSRRALGYDEWNLYGISYGTRLALTVLRDHPEGIRSVILDSTLPVQADLLDESPANVQRALDVFFGGCAADPPCAAAYPGLEASFYALLQDLDARPRRAQVTDVFTNASYDAVVDGVAMLGTTIQALYITDAIPVLPQLITDVAQGDMGLWSTLASNLLANEEFFSAGMLASVQCREEIPFSDPADVAEQVAAYPAIEGAFEESINTGASAFRLCDLWQAGVAGPIENEPVSSDVPTLIMAGEYDPVTPPAWGRRAAETLSNSYFFEFPGTGHGASLAGDCPASIIDAFLADPASAPDSSCVGEMGAPAFQVPGAAVSPVRLVEFSTTFLGTTITGVVPEGWDEIGPGAWARQSNALDQAAILQQAAPGVPPETIADLLAGQLGAGAPERAGSIDAGGRSWARFEFTAQGQPADLAVTDEGGTALIVLLISPGAERDALFDAVFLPALEAIDLG